jgi:hypothetical protein
MSGAMHTKTTRRQTLASIAHNIKLFRQFFLASTPEHWHNRKCRTMAA